MKRILFFATAAAAVLLSVRLFETAVRAAEPAKAASALPGITAREKNVFDLGFADFQEVEDEASGLGPAFNGPGCASCHSIPEIGGHGNMTVLRAGRLVGGTFQELGGGSLIHLFSNPGFQCQPVVPAEANVRARRITTPIFGAGLIESIADSAIQSREDPDDRDGDGIRGRAALIVEPGETAKRVGRFGWKNQHATLLAFGADAYRNEVGITNDLFPTEFAAGLTAEQLAACDAAQDPEDIRDPANGNLRGIDLLASFMRFLAPPQRGPATPESRRGETLFGEIGCAWCHVPSMTTDRNTSTALDRKEAALYSDLLLHDVGTGDGIAQGAALPNEFRTAPLWGLRFRRLLMHDGSALGPEAAVEAHKGEANRSRERYEALSAGQKADLLAFLGSL